MNFVKQQIWETELKAQEVRNVIIVGNSAEAWMTALCVAKLLKGLELKIQVVNLLGEQNTPRAETLLPGSHQFHQVLGLNLKGVMRTCKGTFSLGSLIRGWQADEHQYFNAYSKNGADFGLFDFHQVLRKIAELQQVKSIDSYCLSAVAAKQNKFVLPVSDPKSIYSTIQFGVTVDSYEYAQFLRAQAKTLGIEEVALDYSGCRRDNDGLITEIVGTERAVKGEFFVDCSQQGVLISDDFGEFKSWRAWLPFDRILRRRIASDKVGNPYRRISLGPHGWHQISHLQGNVEHCYVYSSELANVESARRWASNHSGVDDGDLWVAEAFQPGLREALWKKNCLNLSDAGFALEQFDIGKLSLVQSMLLQFVELFPRQVDDLFCAAEFNRFSKQLLFDARDYHLLHYSLISENQTLYERLIKRLDLPESLKRQNELFKVNGLIEKRRQLLVPDHRIATAYLANSLWPSSYHPLVDMLDFQHLCSQLASLPGVIQQAANPLPSHETFLQQFLGVGM